jgi:hypothetical protein
MCDLNAAGWNIYIGANPREDQGRRSEDIPLARCVCVDFDGGMTAAGTRWCIEDQWLPASTVTVNSGHGTQCWWRLEDAITDLPDWTGRQRSLIGLLTTDRSIVDPPRLMRLPGFRNHKPPAADAVLVEADPRRVYPLDEFPEAAVRASRGGSYQRLHEGSTDIRSTSVRNQPEVWRAVKRFVCTALDQRRRRIFYLAKTWRGFPGAEPEWFNEPFCEWHRRSLPNMNHKELELSWGDFLDAWYRVEYPGLSGPLADALDEALRKPLPNAALRFPTTGMRQTVALCCQLQRLRGNRPFFLIQERAADLLEVSQKTVGDWLRRFQRGDDPVLRLVTKGHTGWGSEYFYLPPLDDWSDSQFDSESGC